MFWKDFIILTNCEIVVHIFEIIGNRLTTKKNYIIWVYSLLNLLFLFIFPFSPIWNKALWYLARRGDENEVAVK